MNKEVIVGNTADSDREYVTITKHSERPLGALLGFIAGCLISLLAHDSLELLEIVIVLLASTTLVALISDGERIEAIPKSRVDKIVGKKGLGKKDKVSLHCHDANYINHRHRNQTAQDRI